MLKVNNKIVNEAEVILIYKSLKF